MFFRHRCVLLILVLIANTSLLCVQAHSSIKAQPTHSTVQNSAATASGNRSADLTEKHARSSFSEQNYGHQVWGASGGNRFEMTHLIPPVLLAGLLLLLLPICAGLFAPMFAGHSGMAYPSYPHGRKKRNIFEESGFGFDPWPLSAMQLIRPFLDTLHKSLQKYSK